MKLITFASPSLFLLRHLFLLLLNYLSVNCTPWMGLQTCCSTTGTAHYRLICGVSLSARLLSPSSCLVSLLLLIIKGGLLQQEPFDSKCLTEESESGFIVWTNTIITCTDFITHVAVYDAAAGHLLASSDGLLSTRSTCAATLLFVRHTRGSDAAELRDLRRCCAALLVRRCLVVDQVKELVSLTLLWWHRHGVAAAAAPSFTHRS